MAAAARTVAIIAARGGSKGVPGKNLRPVGGIPLVAHRSPWTPAQESQCQQKLHHGPVAASARMSGVRLANSAAARPYVTMRTGRSVAAPTWAGDDRDRAAYQPLFGLQDSGIAANVAALHFR